MHKISAGVEVWFGNMRHDGYCVIVDSIFERVTMNPVDVEEYRASRGHDSYLIPDEYDGEILFSFFNLERLTS